jgi:hypothetical protein
MNNCYSTLDLNPSEQWSDALLFQVSLLEEENSGESIESEM